MYSLAMYNRIDDHLAHHYLAMDNAFSKDNS